MKKSVGRKIFLVIFVACGFVGAAEPLEEDPFLPGFDKMCLSLGTNEEDLLESVERHSFIKFQSMQTSNEWVVSEKNKFLFYIRRFVLTSKAEEISEFHCLIPRRITVSFKEIVRVKDSRTIELKSRRAEKIYNVIREQLRKLNITPPEDLIVQRSYSKWDDCAIS